MPWTAADARRHAQGLTAHQAQVWSRVANNALRACTATGGSQQECEGRAIRQANAVAQRAPAKAVKLADDGTLSVLAIPFGGPIEGAGGKGLDTDGEYFSERTDLCLDWFPTHRPLLYHHGLDDDLQVTPIGKVDITTAARDEAGWWLRAQLDKSNRYWAEIAELIDEDRMFASSGAMPHLVKRAKDGEILRWPWVELSLTPTPANFFAMVQPTEAKAHYKAAGIAEPPTIDDDDTRSYADLLDRLTDDSGEFLVLTRRLAEGRTKVGRALSRKRREQLLALADQWESGAKDLRQIVAEAEPKPGEPDEGEADAEREAKTAPPLAYDVSGRPYCSACGDSGSGPCEYHARKAGRVVSQNGSSEDDGGKGAAAHAPSELASIFERFQQDDTFYGAVLTRARR